MGNCTGSNREKDELTMRPSRQELNNNLNNDGVCQSDPRGVTDTFPTLENNEIDTKLNLSSRTPPCKIPILKDCLTRCSQLNHSKGSYKSVFDRSLSSRIPMTSTNVECRKSVPILHAEDGLSETQFYESGFVSDHLLNASIQCQTKVEVKAPENAANVTVLRTQRPMMRPANIIIRDYIKENVDKVIKSDFEKTKAILPEVIPARHSLTNTKSVSTYNVDSRIKRPHSLSAETEIILNKAVLKNKTAVNDLATPLIAVSEESSVMKDVSSLKLMLHKLKRYLTQDGYEGLSDAMSDYLLRLPPSSAVDIKALSRDQLEHQYELLVTKNSKLERLLESREMVIAKLQAEKQLSDKVTHSSAIVDNQESDTCQRDHCQRLGLDNLTYQWSNLKLPQEHI